MENVPMEARVMLNRMLRDFHNTEMQQEAERDRANKKYSSTIFENGMRWRYWEIKPAGVKNKRVRFCYTTTANAVRCYLTFVETTTGKRKIKVKRERIQPHDTRREAKQWALKLFREFKETV